MTTSAHSHNNYNRRAVAPPYTIPAKHQPHHQQYQHNPYQQHEPSHHHLHKHAYYHHFHTHTQPPVAPIIYANDLSDPSQHNHPLQRQQQLYSDHLLSDHLQQQQLPHQHLQQQHQSQQPHQSPHEHQKQPHQSPSHQSQQSPRQSLSQRQHPDHQHRHPDHKKVKPERASSPEPSKNTSLSREFVVRRISEGEAGRHREGLKCEACGKTYKHVSSLAKHLWEHTPEWNVTKKLLISKHQQVQLLEAASILVGMNENQPSSNKQDDVKNSSPFSPSNSAETNATSAAPTPPMNSTDSKINTSSHPGHYTNGHKNSDAINSNGAIEGQLPVAHFHRSNSHSKYPPKVTQSGANGQIYTDISGGYLDSPVIITGPQGEVHAASIAGPVDNRHIVVKKQRSNSVFEEEEDVDADVLKSPPAHHQAAGPSLPPLRNSRHFSDHSHLTSPTSAHGAQFGSSPSANGVMSDHSVEEGRHG